MNTDNNTSNNLYEHDPRLTAYALGEMDAADRAAYELELRDNPAAQTAIAEIREMAAQLETALAHEATPEAATAGNAEILLGGRREASPQTPSGLEAEGRQSANLALPAEQDWRAAREAEAARARRADDPYARKGFRFPYFLVAGFGLACFAVIFFLVQKNQHLERQLAQSNRTVINGKTYEPIDLNAVTESTAATTTAPATSSVAVVTSTNNLAASAPSIGQVKQLAMDETATPPVNFGGGLYAVPTADLPRVRWDDTKQNVPVNVANITAGEISGTSVDLSFDSNSTGAYADSFALGGRAQTDAATLAINGYANTSGALYLYNTTGVTDASGVTTNAVTWSGNSAAARQPPPAPTRPRTATLGGASYMIGNSSELRPVYANGGAVYIVNGVVAVPPPAPAAYDYAITTAGSGTLTLGASAPNAGAFIGGMYVSATATYTVGGAVTAKTLDWHGGANVLLSGVSGTITTLTTANPNITFPGGEAYTRIPANPFLRVADAPLSTFSADVDTASYTNLRRFLNNGQRPPPDAVRIEEMLNYFTYDYAPPAKNSATPFAATMEVASAPWNPAHRLVRIGIKGRELDNLARPPANIVFLIDVSGSMDTANKLPLIKESMRMLLGKLRPDDRIAIVTYASGTSLALASTPVRNKAEILAVLDSLRADGSTNGGAGIQLAYDIAKANFVKDGTNRVILCTDGDFNVGTVNRDALVSMIEEKAKSGVYLSVLGFGMGNYKDALLQRLADKGNGNYGYIDTRDEARRQFVDRTDSLLNTIAKDVKLQVEFNPAQVAAYRLIGYEKRALAAQDFNNDKVDAGEIGAGHTVTALYEIIPARPAAADVSKTDTDTAADNDYGDVGYVPEAVPPVDPLKYQTQTVVTNTPKPDATGELLTLKIRYKLPNSDTSDKVEFTLKDSGATFENASNDFKFASAVAAFGMLLRNSPDSGQATYDAVLAWGEPATGEDPQGQRAEFFDLVRRARHM